MINAKKMNFSFKDLLSDRLDKKFGDRKTWLEQLFDALDGNALASAELLGKSGDAQLFDQHAGQLQFLTINIAGSGLLLIAF